jgi:hypothetical protein
LGKDKGVKTFFVESPRGDTKTALWDGTANGRDAIGFNVRAKTLRAAIAAVEAQQKRIKK